MADEMEQTTAPRPASLASMMSRQVRAANPNRTAPVFHEPAQQLEQPDLRILLNQFTTDILKMVDKKTDELVDSARKQEKATSRLDASLNRSIKANPEQLVLMEGELKRANMEIQTLQSDLKRTRTALRGVMEGGSKKFWLSMARNITDHAEVASDLLDLAPDLRDGKIEPDVGKRMMAFLRTFSEELSEFADNCRAYAEDDE